MIMDGAAPIEYSLWFEVAKTRGAAAEIQFDSRSRATKGIARLQQYGPDKLINAPNLFDSGRSYGH